MQRENPITQIKKYIPVQLNCPICQHEYNQESRSPMLICVNQHCLCRQCLESCFQYSEYEDEAACPFCKQPVYSDCIQKFRLMEEVVEATNGLNKYNNSLKSYISKIIGDQRELEMKLEDERKKNAELAAKIQFQTSQTYNKNKQKNVKPQHNYSIPKPRTKSTVSSGKNNTKLPKKENIKKVKQHKTTKTLTTKVKTIANTPQEQEEEQILTNRYKLQYAFISESFQQIDRQEFDKDQRFQKPIRKNYISKPTKTIKNSSTYLNKTKKDVSNLLNDPYKINPAALKLIGKKTGLQYQQRIQYIYILAQYDFTRLRELQLKGLSLNQNHLVHLSQDQSLFPYLTRLDLSKNRLNRIPQFIFGLKSLVFLDLNSNKIKEISKELKSLRNLKELELWNNQIQELPSFFQEMKKLQLLDLSNNRIRQISRFLLCSLLVKIDLYGNPVQKR